MKKIYFITILITSFVFAGCAQNNKQDKSLQKNSNQKVGAPCEGCEAIYEQAPAFNTLTWIDTLPDFNDAGPKMVISGIIYKVDGKTPAPGVILYVYHTDQTGRYTPKDGQTGWARRNGYIRGWMKTNEKGQYKFYTLKPAPYPGAKIPAHIHPIIKEPDKNEYWIDEYLFDDDPFLTTKERNSQQGLGGNGIITLEKKEGTLYGERNIYLGRNVPHYPLAKLTGLQSGLELGDNCPAFDPLHISGADKGKHACPMCKYGYQQGIMVWINHPDLNRLNNFAKILDTEMKERGEKKLRVFLIYMNPEKKSLVKLTDELKKWCTAQNLQRVALVLVPSSTDPNSSDIFKINPSPKVQNTVFVYRKRQIADKWININYDEESLKVQVILQSPPGWSPTSGVYDKKGNLWLMEANEQPSIIKTELPVNLFFKITAISIIVLFTMLAAVKLSKRFHKYSLLTSVELSNPYHFPNKLSIE